MRSRRPAAEPPPPEHWNPENGPGLEHLNEYQMAVLNRIVPTEEMLAEEGEKIHWDPPEDMSPSAERIWRRFYAGIKIRYGITPRQYRAIYLAQSGRCYICRVARGKHPDDPKARGGRRLGVDHNHVTNQIRGLLCSGGDKTCNRIIGWLRSPEALERAAYYVRNEPARLPLEMLSKGATDADLVGVLIR